MENEPIAGVPAGFSATWKLAHVREVGFSYIWLSARNRRGYSSEAYRRISGAVRAPEDEA
jgi:hypothetical protein